MVFERDVLARVVPFALYMGFVVLADGLEWLGVGAGPLRYLYGVKILIVLTALLYYRRLYVELRWRGGSASAWLVAIAAGLLVLVLWVSLDAPWMRVGNSGGFDPRFDGVIDWPLAVLRVVGAALVVPVMEELFWRSFLMRSLAGSFFLDVDPARVRAGAFVVVVILFGIEHNLWLAGMIAGVVYGALYAYGRNLWLSIVAHSVTNGFLGAWIIVTGNWSYW